MNDKLIEALNFLNTLSKEDIKTQFEKSFKKFEDVKYDDSFFININNFDTFFMDLKNDYSYSEDIIGDLKGYCIAA